MSDQKKGVTVCGVRPRHNNVIVRADYSMHPLVITDKQILHDQKQVAKYTKDDVTYTVVAMGPEVFDLEIGQVVYLPARGQYDEVRVEGNDRSYEAIAAAFAKLDSADIAAIVKAGEYVRLQKYVLLVDFQAPVIIKEAPVVLGEVNEKVSE